MFFFLNSIVVLANWSITNFEYFDQKQFQIGLFLPMFLIALVVSQGIKAFKTCVKMFD